MVPRVCRAHASSGVALASASWQKDLVGQLAATVGWSADTPQRALLSAHQEAGASSCLPESHPMRLRPGSAGLPQRGYAGGRGWSSTVKITKGKDSGAVLITQELHGLMDCKRQCCPILTWKFSSLSQQKVFSCTVLWFLVLENNQSLQKHKSHLWLTSSQDDTDISHCTRRSLRPVLWTATQVGVPMKIKWLNLLHTGLQGFWHTSFFSQK